MKITLNNHASVTIETDDINIITDPWFTGDAFNNGWKLIYENPEPEEFFLKKINYIWISHEHPDHFQPGFFIRNRNFIEENKIKILFQKTKDKRVVNFFNKIKLNIQEIDNNKKTQISEKTSIIIFNAELYDSSLFVSSGNHSTLNLNDCSYSDSELIEIKKKCNKIDTLLTQFSYAAWKGGKNNIKWRIDASYLKLDEIKKQFKLLNCQTVIPIASFIYFSHKDNFYMNDSINTVEKVCKFLSLNNLNYKILSPNTTYEVGIDDYDDSISKIFWKNEYDNINRKKINNYSNCSTLEDLDLVFQSYKKKIFKENNFYLMKLVSVFKIFNIFQPIIFYITDLKKYIKFSFFNNKLEEVNLVNSNYVKIHSSSLFFVLNNNFGFDTLTVNGLFESDYNNFKKLVFNFGLGSYNAAGMYISIKSIFNLKVILLIYEKVKKLKLNF
jgi:UDP-MurNAc hydroxylase